jgi:hypothetical protein
MGRLDDQMRRYWLTALGCHASQNFINAQLIGSGAHQQTHAVAMIEQPTNKLSHLTEIGIMNRGTER